MNDSIHQSPFHLRYRYPLLLIMIFFTVYILPLGIRPLIIPDETRYAEIPREMLVSGEWVAPHLNGMRYFEKPVLGYWVHALSIHLFGENNFAVRLPGPVSVGLSALLIFFLVYRSRNHEEEYDNVYNQSGRAKQNKVSFLAAFIFLLCFEVFGVGNTAVLDNILALFSTATITFFYFASESSPGSRREKLYLLLSGTACGLAFMTKGFLAFAVPVLTLSVYLIWERRYRDLWRMSWFPLLTAILVSLPWSIMIYFREPDFWNFFFWNEHVRRFIGGNAQHKAPFFYYILTAPGMIMPWTFVTPVAFSGIKERFREPEAEGRLMRLALCWLVLPFIFFSCANGKLLTYILPCFPPFAILMAFGLLQGLKKAQRIKFFSWGARINMILFGLILLAFIVVQLSDIMGFRPYHQPWKVLPGINALVAAIILFKMSCQSRKKTSKIILLGLAPWLLFMSSHFILPDFTIEKKAPGPLLERYQQNLKHETIVITEKRLIRAVCWYLKRDDVYILGRSGELEYGLAYKDAIGRQLDLKSVADLIRRHPGNTILIARTKKLNQWRDQLPQPICKANNGAKEFAIWKF